MAVNSATANAAPPIAGAIRQAARSSGISFEYLITTAQIESNPNPAAQAATSSAKGLHQFIDQTWLGTMKASGPASGYGQYADAISRSPDEHYDVFDPAMRTAIMQLRSDPAASAMMAGAFTRANATQLQSAIGRAPTEGELYMAHFLGSDGAGKLIATATTQSQANAADMFPQAATANTSIFYDSAGRPRSAGDVYAKLTSRFEVARAISFAPGLRTASTTDIVRSPPPDIVRPPIVRNRALAVTRHCRRHASFCADERQSAAAAGQKAAVPDHVHRSRAQNGDANCQQSVGAGKNSHPGRPGAAARSVHRHPTQFPQTARRRRHVIAGRGRSAVVNSPSISMVNALLSLVG